MAGSKYNTPWIPMAKNEDFWKEVLVGRKIQDVVFDEAGIEYFLLDSGEKVFVENKSDSRRIYIQD